VTQTSDYTSLQSFRNEPGARPTVTPNRDEIHRQLRAADTEQRGALPRFVRALRRSSDPDSNTSAAEQGALLGVPHSRRGFLRLGGITVAASAVLVACGSPDSDTTIIRTGPTPGESSATPPRLEPSTELSTTLLLTAGSIEALAIAAYDAALSNNWLGDTTLNSVARLFRDQHAEHLDAVSAATRQLGETPYTDPNPFLFDNVVAPAVDSITALEPEDQQLATLELAYTLEDVAAQTYTSAGGLFNSAELRQAGMSIGAVEARHVSVLLSVLGEPAAPFAFGRTINAVDEDAFITTDGPVTPSQSDEETAS